jgi:membrane protein required for colicin V production
MLHSFNLLDWAVFMVMLVSILIGFFWGLFRTLVSALIWGLSFFVSMLAGPSLSSIFGNYVGNGSLQLWLTYGVVFVATIIISAIAKIILRFMLTPNQIGLFDRMGGAVFGFVRGVLIVSVFLWFLVLSGLGNGQGGMYQTSVLASWFQPYVNLISEFFPSISGEIQAANQNMGRGQQPQQPGQNNGVAPTTQNPYNYMGPGGSTGSGGLLSQIPGMQNILPWISTLWNMMINQVKSVL